MSDAEGAKPIIDVDFSDQIGFFNPYGFADTLTIIGVGGIGATVLPVLVTMGFKRFVIWDDDVVEARNIASQMLYAPSDLYHSKAEITRDYLLHYGAAEVVVKQRRFTAKDQLDRGVVVSGVDTMTARQAIWKAVKKSEASLYLDGRIGGEHMSLLVVDPIDGDWYEDKWLFDDAEAAELPCTERAVVYPAVSLGAHMAAVLASWSRGISQPRRIDHHLGTLFYQVVWG